MMKFDEIYLKPQDVVDLLPIPIKYHENHNEQLL